MAARQEGVEFDVGGQQFKVARSTIMKFPDTMLGALLERWDTDSKPVFIDRDPHRFRYILDFYRDGAIVLPHCLRNMMRDWCELKPFGCCA